MIKLGVFSSTKGYYGSFESEKLRKVYIFNNIQYSHDIIFEHCPNLEKVIYDSPMGPPLNMFKRHEEDVIYLQGYSPKYKLTDYQIERLRFDNYHLPANVVYMYNYPDGPNNGYYFIDDYDNELISYIPENPTRALYTFAGWYKEPSINGILKGILFQERTLMKMENIIM